MGFSNNYLFWSVSVVEMKCKCLINTSVSVIDRNFIKNIIYRGPLFLTGHIIKVFMKLIRNRKTIFKRNNVFMGTAILKTL